MPKLTKAQAAVVDAMRAAGGTAVLTNKLRWTGVSINHTVLKSLVKLGIVRPPANWRSNVSTPGTYTLVEDDSGKTKTTAQIRSEVSQLSELLADPAAARTFAREMRHELQKKQLSEKTAQAMAASPFVVMRMEGGRREVVGRYRTEGDARSAADRVGGWIELEGRVIYGSGP